MGIAAVKLRVMPISPDVNLSELKGELNSLLEKNEAKNSSITEEPIAFGLVALVLFFGWDENRDLESFQNKILNLENVPSTEVIDMRRAFG